MPTLNDILTANGDYTPVSGYPVDDKYENDSPVINVYDRTIGEIVGDTSTSGENVSQYLTFRIPRHPDHYDLIENGTNIRILYRLEDDTGEDVVPVNVVANEDYIIFGWKIPLVVTVNPGVVTFIIHAYKSENNIITYHYKTLPKTYMILETMETDVVVPDIEMYNLAEAYARGTITDVFGHTRPVEEGEPGYHDNSKYYKELAETAVNGIQSVTKTSTSGLVDTYTILYTNGTTSIFEVTNGEDGQDGHTPTITASKTDKVTTVYVDGVAIATINDGVDGQGAVTDVTVNGVTVMDGDVAKVIVPTKVSDLTNDSGFITSEAAVNLTTRMSAIETEQSVQSARIDTFTSLPEGSTSGNAELADIRVGADGTTYDTAGNAVRGQIGELKSDVSNHLNGFVYNEINFTVVPGAYVDNKTGAFVTYEGWDRTDYIEVDATTDLYIESAGTMNFCAVYDENKTFVSSLSISTGFNYLYIRGDVKYIALSTTTGNLAKVKIWNTDIHKVNGSVNKETDFSNNLINVPWRIGSLDSNGAYNHTWYRLVSDYIELPYKGAEHVIEFNSTWVISIAEYDENKEFIYISSYISNDTIRVFSPNTKFIRMMAYDSADETYVKVGDIWSSGISVTVTGLPHKLKVMSYNLGHYAYGTGIGLPANIYDKKLIAYRRFIGEELPDICGFQEYDSKMDEENTILATDVLWGHYYPHKYITGSQTALFAKKWISWGGTKQLSTGRYYTEGTMNGIYLISVHPSVGADKASTRIQECTEVINIVKQYERYIIFGDFNCEPNEEDSLFKLFTDEGMNIANCGWFGKFYTWSSNRADFDDYENPTGTLCYIDNIITSPNINITNVYPVPKAYSLLSSDHIPIIAELEIN